MEELDLKQESIEKRENIYNKKEYSIKNENNNYILRLEINENDINMVILLNDNFEYNYKTKINLSMIVNKLELDPIKYSNAKLILKIFDEIYDNKKIFININNKEFCTMKIELIRGIKESLQEFKLFKKYNEINDKFFILFNEIKLLKNKDNIINEMNNKIIMQERKIELLENEIKKNKNNGNEIKILKDKIENLENFINNQIKEIINSYNNINKKINQFNNKIKEQENFINNNNIIIDDLLNNIKETMNDEIESKIKFYDYEKKINYRFINEPKNLKFRENIVTTNTDYGWNEIFEIFISYKDGKEYLSSPNVNNYNLDIFRLIDNKKMQSLKGHKNDIRTIRYFINNKNKNEYLISGDNDKKVIIWDITNNYKNIYNIDTKYGGSICSCLLVFPNNIDSNYLITSTFNASGNDEDSATKLFLLKEKETFIKYINNTSKNNIYYLLSWFNKKNNKYYIIQFSYKKIMINNLLEDELYFELIKEPEGNHFSGFIYNKNNNDYLCSSSDNGYINIWDLYNKAILKVIDTNGYLKGSKLAHIIEWNRKYIIVAEVNYKLIKIIDRENDLITDINSNHAKDLICLKKINHPIYGESLISAANDKIIKLWIVD